MQPANCYYNRAKISEAKFWYVLRLFALDLTAADTARLTGLSVRAVNDLYLRLRRRLRTWCPVGAGQTRRGRLRWFDYAGQFRALS